MGRGCPRRHRHLKVPRFTGDGAPLRSASRSSRSRCMLGVACALPPELRVRWRRCTMATLTGALRAWHWTPALSVGCPPTRSRWTFASTLSSQTPRSPETPQHWCGASPSSSTAPTRVSPRLPGLSGGQRRCQRARHQHHRGGARARLPQHPPNASPRLHSRLSVVGQAQTAVRRCGGRALRPQRRQGPG